MTKKRGIALVTVLMVAGILLAVVSAGLKLGSSGVLFVSQAHKRNVALSAAEAGVYEAIVAIQKDRFSNGTVSGTLSESGATYSYTLKNQLANSSEATVVSTGEYGGVRRTLRVELEADSAGFQGASLGGKVYLFDQAYFNAIASSNNPVARPGHAHSQYSAGPLSFVARDYDGNGKVGIHSTGVLSAGASYDSNLSRTAKESLTNTSRPQYRLDKNLMLGSGGFTSKTPAQMALGGTLSSNTIVDLGGGGGTVTINGQLIVPKGITLHIKNGNLELLGGISGDGQIVVEGDALLRANNSFDSATKEGIKLLAEGTAFVAHPSASGGTADLHLPPPNVVGDYFAQMPLEATYELSTNIPTSAPKGGAFFSWFDANVDHGDANFLLWYNGDGTDINPGLSEETKQWLAHSRPIHGEIQSWADSP